MGLQAFCSDQYVKRTLYRELNVRNHTFLTLNLFWPSCSTTLLTGFDVYLFIYLFHLASQLVATVKKKWSPFKTCIPSLSCCSCCGSFRRPQGRYNFDRNKPEEKLLLLQATKVVSNPFVSISLTFTLQSNV